jgi:hypothetical protein
MVMVNIFLMTNGGKHDFPVLIFHPHVFFGEVSIQILCLSFSSYLSSYCDVQLVCRAGQKASSLYRGCLKDSVSSACVQ